MKTQILDKCKALLGEHESDLCQNGAVQLRVHIEDDRLPQLLSRLLQEEGFSLYAERTEETLKFETWERGSVLVHLSVASSLGELRILVSEGEALPPRQAAYEVRVTPQLTQLRQAYCRVDCGMSYVIRLCDGRFVLIDGGFDEYEEVERLLEVLETQNTVFEKPRIAACFITHAHEDHFSCFLHLMREYGDRVELEMLAYNWVVDEMCRGTCDHRAVDEMAARLQAKGCKLVTPHTGQRFCLADATFDVLFACEDIYPNVIMGINNTSFVMRMEQQGRRVLWLGDAEPQACNEICRRFPAGSLQCELLQVGHHGYGGGSQELYRRADPQALLWPCPDFWYEPVRAWEANRFLRESKRIEHTYISGRGTVTLDMTRPLPSVEPERQYAEGEVIADWNFADISRVIDLEWSCVTGGKTGYRAPQLTLTPQGECCIVAGEQYSMVELLRPGLLQNVSAYSVQLSGHLGTAGGEAAWMYDCQTPTLPESLRLLPMELLPGEPFSMELSLQRETGASTVSLNGGAPITVPYEPDQKGGLYLVLRNGELYLKTLSVIADR